MLFVGIGVLIVAWGLYAAFALVGARRDAQRGYDILTAAQGHLTVADLLHGNADGPLAQAHAAFAVAQDRVGGAVLAPLEYLPWIGRQLRSVDALTAGARDITSIGAAALTDARARIDAAGHPHGEARVALVRDLGAIARSAEHRLDPIGLGPDQGLLGPLRRAHDRFDDKLGGIRRSVHDLVDATTGFARFLEGPSRYLVVAANTAQMRAGSGAFLSLGELSVDAGKFRLGALRPAGELRPPPGAVDPADSGDPDFAARFGFLGPTADFRQLPSSARFDVTAPLAVRMWKASTGHTVDGVLVLDPVALQALLRATGPVVVDGVTYSADNLLAAVLVDQYRGVGYDPNAPEQIARRDVLAQIARAAFDHLEQGSWQAADLIQAMRSAGLGRHVLGWAADPTQRLGWHGLHLDGTFGPDALLIGVHNRVGNKLDQFLPIDGSIRSEVSGARRSVTLTLRIVNGVPLPLDQWPVYVVGPVVPAPGAPPLHPAGEYEGLVTAELPRAASNTRVTVDGRPAGLVVVGRDGPDHRVVGVEIVLQPGETRTVVAHFDLPARASLLVEPSARVLHPSFAPIFGAGGIVWHADGQTWPDDRSHRIQWTGP